MTDKTAALLRHIASMPRGAMFLPRGGQWPSIHALKRRKLIETNWSKPGSGYRLTLAGRCLMSGGE